MKKDNVLLSRRHSGGGTVYQDHGCSVFTFLNPVLDGSSPFNQKKHNNKILLKALKNQKINGEVQGRNDLTYKGKKFSGSAYEVEVESKGITIICNTLNLLFGKKNY